MAWFVAVPAAAVPDAAVAVPEVATGHVAGTQVRRAPDRDGLGEPQQLPQQRDAEQEVPHEEARVPFERVQQHHGVGEGAEVARDPQLRATARDRRGPHHLDGPEQPDRRELRDLLHEPRPGRPGPPLVEDGTRRRADHHPVDAQRTRHGVGQAGVGRGQHERDPPQHAPAPVEVGPPDQVGDPGHDHGEERRTGESDDEPHQRPAPSR
jgi:hypothetical protein